MALVPVVPARLPQISIQKSSWLGPCTLQMACRNLGNPVSPAAGQVYPRGHFQLFSERRIAVGFVLLGSKLAICLIQHLACNDEQSSVLQQV